MVANRRMPLPESKVFIIDAASPDPIASGAYEQMRHLGENYRTVGDVLKDDPA